MPPFLPSLLSSLFLSLLLHQLLHTTSAKVKTNSTEVGVELDPESAISPSSVCEANHLELAIASRVHRILSRVYDNMKKNKSKERVKMMLVLMMFGYHLSYMKSRKICTKQPEQKMKEKLLVLKRANMRKRFRWWIVGMLKLKTSEEAWKAILEFLMRAH